jgi:hypothetical protein
VIHTQAKPLQDSGQVPWVNAVAVDRRLEPNRIKAGAVEECRPQGVIVERLIEPGDGARCAFERSQ